MPTCKPINRRPLALQPRDFTYVYESGIGQCYLNGPYVIIVGSRSYYAANYQGRTIAYNLRDFLSAVEACAKHEAARRAA
jgi:hypothetical protein